MSWTDSLLLAPFAVLAVAALPLPRSRRAVLTLLHRGGHSAAVAGIVACGVFAVWPHLAPEPLTGLLAATAPDGHAWVAWLVKAVLLLALALPLLALLDHARELAAHTAFLRALQHALRALPDAEGAPSPEKPHTHLAEIAAAVEAMRTAPGTARPPSPNRPKLVKHLFD